MKIRIIHNADGSVSIFHPVPKSRREDETEQDWFERVAARSTPEGATYEDVERETVEHFLSDRTFRNAWTSCPENKIKVDMEKAKDIQRDKWRAVRKPLLEALDVEYMRADEAGDTVKKNEIKAKKQALRDVTLTDLSGVNTPEELKAVWPEILKG